MNLLPRLDAIEARIRKLPTKRFIVICAVATVASVLFGVWLMLHA
jgi:hypothetical protein